MKKKNIWTLLGAFLLVFALTGNVPASAEEASGEPEKVTKTFEFHVSEDDAGWKLADTDLFEMFVVDPIEAAGGQAVISDDGNGYITSFSHVYIDRDTAYDCLSEAYTFQIDFYSTTTTDTSYSKGALYVRAIDPNSYTITNPMNQGTQQKFDFYEWDWYVENGGENGSSGTGGSGLKVYQTDSKICICIKTYAEDGLNVVGETAELDFPEGFKPGEMNTYKFVDDGKSKIELFINDVLLCSVEYGGEPSAYPDGDDQDSEVLYYKNAVVKDANGAEVLNVDNARLCAEYSTLAIGSRDDIHVYFNNIILAYETDAPKPTTPPTEKPTDEVPSASTPAGSNNASNTQAHGSTKAPAATNSSSADAEDGGVPEGLIVGICAGVVVLSVAVIVITIVTKKKK